MRAIDSADIRGIPTDADKIRKLAANQVDRRIEEAVGTLNKHGYIVMGSEK
jgi:predicted nuclease with TOPRIM domain